MIIFKSNFIFFYNKKPIDIFDNQEQKNNFNKKLI